MESLRSRIILHHTCLMEQLELKYMNYINQLLVQKSKLSLKMQHDFYKEMHNIQILEYQSHMQTGVKSNNAHNALTEHSDQINIRTDDTVQSDEVQDDESTMTDRLPVMNPSGQTQGIQDDRSSTSDESLSALRFELETSDVSKHATTEPNDRTMSRTQSDQINCTGAPSADDSEVQRQKCESDQPIHKPISKPISKSPNSNYKLNKKRYKCSYCNKRWRSHTDLTIHIRTHTNERPFTCTYPNCDKAFKQKYTLTTHIRTHTGEKPYQCNICQKRFTISGNRNRHVKMMHDKKS
eukprot:633817_1